MILSICVSMYSRVEGGEEMKPMKAVVLEKKGSLLTILADDGSFQKIRYKRNVEIGSEIELSNVQRRQPFWRVAVSIAAVFLLTLIGSMGWSAYQATTAAAMISVDINPRLQLTLDQKGRVLKAESLNSDAERVLQGLPLKGESWNQAISEIIGQSTALNYLNSDHLWVLVGYSPIKEGSAIPAGVNTDEIAQKIESAAQAQGMKPEIVVYQLSADEQKTAQEKGLTLGEYALLNTAQKAGLNVDANTVKNTAERVKLLEEPQVKHLMDQEEHLKENDDSKAASSGIISKDKGNSDEGSNSNSDTNDNSKNNPSVNQSTSHGNRTDFQSGKSANKPLDPSHGKLQQDQNEQDTMKDNAGGNRDKSGSKENEENQNQNQKGKGQ